MIRSPFVWLHRWTGLLLAGFLIIEGLTGSLLAFNSELTGLLNPQLAVIPPAPNATPLDLATLAERAESLVPQARVDYFSAGGPGPVFLRCSPREDPATGQPYDIGFKYLVLDPWTGMELGRLEDKRYGRGFAANIMPFVYDLHMSLALGEAGAWVLGLIALVWTLDCFTGFYLTLPVALSAFWRRWKPSWLVKWPPGFFRLNFDLHRAGGLWFWPLLFVFAWSSVMLEMHSTYEFVTRSLFDYQSEMDNPTLHPNELPRLDWRAAQTIGERLMDEQAARRGFTVARPYGLGYVKEFGVYAYAVQGSRDVRERGWNTSLWLDGDTGALRSLDLPTGEHSGNTISNWLWALHYGDVFGWLAYRVFVCIFGLAIALLSITGVYIWWRKRQARKWSAARRRDMVARGALDDAMDQTAF